MAMTRTILDENLLLWEVYATTGAFGFPAHARIVFQCLSDPERRARVVTRDGDLASAEHEVAKLPDRELLGLLGQTADLA